MPAGEVGALDGGKAACGRVMLFGREDDRDIAAIALEGDLEVIYVENCERPTLEALLLFAEDGVIVGDTDVTTCCIGLAFGIDSGRFFECVRASI
jgi:hypothetical protein